ncbi:hypothetical protein D3C81_2099400 [compost metagenome]
MLFGRRQAFDGGDAVPRHGGDRQLAGAHRDAVQVYGAGTAQAHAAAELGAGEFQVVTQHP